MGLFGFVSLFEMRLLDGVCVVQSFVFGSLKNITCNVLLLYLKGL